MNEDMLGACEVCWTSSWEEVEEVEQCTQAHPHEGDHVRCGYCYLQQVVRAQGHIILEQEEELISLRLHAK